MESISKFLFLDDGSGYGSGYGDGYGDDDIIAINGNKIYIVDNIPTIITQIRHNYAKGYVLNKDLTLTSCYIAKVENCFAHAVTLKKAVQQATEKAILNMSIERRIEEFWKCHNNTDKYSARDLWLWHNKLTGSCEMGRNRFAAEKEIDIDKDSFTIKEFFEMCKDEYGGDIITQMYSKRPKNK